MQPASTVHWNRTRRAVAAALAAAFVILLPASVTSTWIRGTILSTSGYVAAVAPVAASPAVRSAVQDAVASQVDAVLTRAGTSLPPSARALVGLLGIRLAVLARDWVGRLMAGQAFQRWWADANRLAHSQLIGVLNGDSAVVTTTGGEVVLNLVPLVNDVLHTASGPLSAMAGRAVPLHPVTAVPASACHATGGKASSACTQIPLFPAAALARPRHFYRVLVGVLWLVLVLTALTFAGALAASPRRRRTLLQMSIGGALTVLIVAAAASSGQSSLIGRAAPRFRPVTSVVVHALTNSFFTLTTWCVAGCLAVTAIALLTGHFRRDPPSGYDRIRDRRAFAGCRRRAGRQEDEAPVRRDVQAVRGGAAGARGGHLRAWDQDGPLRHVRGDRGARRPRSGTA